MQVLYMVVERFKDADAVYRRFGAQGRMMPDGVEYLSSWVDQDMRRCFQLMSAECRSRLDLWMSRWEDLIHFEVVPLLSPDELTDKIRDKAGA